MVDRNSLAVAAVGVVLVAGVAGAAYVSDVGDALLGSDETGTTTAESTPTATDGGDEQVAPDGGSSDGSTGGGGDAGSSGGDATSTPEAYDFQFRILNTESCGSTCRDVRVRLTNGGTETATGVTVESRILADGDQIWSGTEDIGTVSPDESTTRTERVNLGVFDAAKVQQNGGYVTVETTVTWDDGSRTFTERIEAT